MCVVSKKVDPIVISDLEKWGEELGFAYIGIADCDLHETELRLNEWLGKGYNADLEYMSKHGTKRTRPEELEPWTRSVIVVGMNYLPGDDNMPAVLADSDKAYLSRYCLGRDYHKVLKKRLGRLAQVMTDHLGEFSYRAFVDSAPVMERALARKAGVGWTGKNAMLINKKNGSFSFLGVLYTDLDLAPAKLSASLCGTCTKCLSSCPTGAIVAPYEVDARRCISYLTIENKGEIPLEFRSAIGNRIYGCDDCQICCPWNRFAQLTEEDDFNPRNDFKSISLAEVFMWSAEDFDQNTLGMAVRRAGYQGWVRNIAVALGNSTPDPKTIDLLKSRRNSVSELVDQHIDWAISQQLSGINDEH